MLKTYFKNTMTFILVFYTSYFTNCANCGNLKLSQKYCDEATNYQRSGDTKKAIIYYTKSLLENPNYIDALINRANLYTEDIDNNALAMADYSRVIKLDPKNIWAYTSRASCYAIAGDFNKALLDFNKAIALDPSNADTYRQRAYTEIRLDQFAKAIVDLKKYAKLDPSYKDDPVCKKYADNTILECQKFIKNNWTTDSHNFCVDGKSLQCIH